MAFRNQHVQRHPDPALLGEAEVTLVDHSAGCQWDEEDAGRELSEFDAGPTIPELTMTRPCPRTPSRRPGTVRAGSEWAERTRDDLLSSAATCGAGSPAWDATPEPLPEIFPMVATGLHLDRDQDDPGPRDRYAPLTAESLRQRRIWKRGATETRRSLAERKDEREALARVLAMARPKPSTTRRARPRSWPRAQDHSPTKKS